MTLVTRWQRSAALISLVALLGLTLSAAGSASADQFTTGNTAPTVSTPTLSASIQPDAGASETEYSYSIVVGDAETLNDLSTVTLCLYLTTGGDSTCATPDPATDVKLTWTQSTNAFTIDQGVGVLNYWALGVSAPSSSPALTGTSGTFTFSFTVSEATREGSWTAIVIATDSSATTATDITATTTVNHYSSITTRAPQDFTTLGAGLASGVVKTASPTVTANGQTTYNMTAGNFTDGTYFFTLATGLASAEPAAGEVALDCQVGSTFAQGSAIRVLSTSTVLSAAETATGTAEGGSVVDNSCRISHGGQRPVGTYSFTVVSAVGNG